MFICAAALTGVGFIDDDGKRVLAVLVANRVQDKGELLDGGDDDLLAGGQEPAQVPRMLGVPRRGRHLGNCLMVSRICLSSTRRSVTTITESNISLAPCSSPTS
jgi:hypothetical protein